MQSNDQPDANGMRAELYKAGWVKVLTNVWKSPNGRLYLGPYGAWKRMKEETK